MRRVQLCWSRGGSLGALPCSSPAGDRSRTPFPASPRELARLRARAARCERRCRCSGMTAALLPKSLWLRARAGALPLDGHAAFYPSCPRAGRARGDALEPCSKPLARALHLPRAALPGSAALPSLCLCSGTFREARRKRALIFSGFFFLLSLESGAEAFFSNVRSEMLGGGSSFSCRVGGRKPCRTGKLHRPRRARSVRPQRQHRGHETQMPLAPRAGTRTRSRTRRLPGLERWNFPRRSVSLYFNSSLLENPFLKRSATDTLS